VIIGSGDPRIYVSSIGASGEVTQIVVNGHGDAVTCLNTHVNNNIFASGSRDKCIRIW
jgi:WD40 repeat protein